MKRFFNSILSVPVSDPDDARRRRVLNILLLGTLVASIVGFLGVIVGSVMSAEITDPETQLLILATLIITIGIMVIYQINKRWSGR